MSGSLAFFVHLFLLAILGTVIGSISALAAFFICGKERRARKLGLAFFLPIIGLYTFYLCMFFGNVIVAEAKNIDVGIGDVWQVPLENRRMLICIDTTDTGFIENRRGECLVSAVTAMREDGGSLFGKTEDGRFFALADGNDEAEFFGTEKELSEAFPSVTLDFSDTQRFYSEKVNAVAGTQRNLVLFISIILTLGEILLLRRLCLPPKKAI